MTVPVTDESEAMRRNTQTSAGHHHLPEATRSRFGRAAASLVSGCTSASAAYFKSMELVCTHFISIVELFVNMHIYCISISTLWEPCKYLVVRPATHSGLSDDASVIGYHRCLKRKHGRYQTWRDPLISQHICPSVTWCHFTINGCKILYIIISLCLKRVFIFITSKIWWYSKPLEAQYSTLLQFINLFWRLFWWFGFNSAADTRESYLWKAMWPD